MRKIFLTFTAVFFPVLFCLVSEGFARDVTLQWDANTETDLAGYKIYYKTASSGGAVLSNYNGVGANEGNSPVNMLLSQDENTDINVVEFTLHGLNNDQTYFFVVTAHNTAGLESSASNEAYANPTSSDTTPPVISNVQVSSITHNSAVVTWMTDEQSTSLVQYGTSSNTWGNYPNSAGNSSMVTSHSVTLTGLSGSTTYYFRVGSTDVTGNGPASSAETAFATNSTPDLEVQGLPVNLTGGTPQSAEVELTLLSIPSGTSSIELTMTVRDADFSNEGRLFINGHGPILLFGTQGISAHDGISVTLSPIATDPAWYQSGQNILTFWHDSTGGYVVENISVNFITSQPGTLPSGLPCGLRIGNR